MRLQSEKLADLFGRSESSDRLPLPDDPVRVIRRQTQNFNQHIAGRGVDVDDRLRFRSRGRASGRLTGGRRGAATTRRRRRRRRGRRRRRADQRYELRDLRERHPGRHALFPCVSRLRHNLPGLHQFPDHVHAVRTELLPVYRQIPFAFPGRRRRKIGIFLIRFRIIIQLNVPFIVRRLFPERIMLPPQEGLDVLQQGDRFISCER